LSRSATIRLSRRPLLRAVSQQHCCKSASQQMLGPAFERLKWPSTQRRLTHSSPTPLTFTLAIKIRLSHILQTVILPIHLALPLQEVDDVKLNLIQSLRFTRPIFNFHSAFRIRQPIGHTIENPPFQIHLSYFYVL
jgi:hypothetical protein